MKGKWLIAVSLCWSGLSSCSNPADENGSRVPGIVLTARERADITLLAGKFSTRRVSGISADSTSYFGWESSTRNEHDFTGTVQYDSAYTDTDKISYQNLRFYNRQWYRFSIDGLPDSEKVFVNNWYSSPAGFTTEEKTVFNINSLTIIALFSGALNKMVITEYLQKITAIQPGLLDTNQQKIIAGFSLPDISSISSSTKQDTTFIDLQCGNWMSTYRFKFVESEFKEFSLMQLIFL